MLQLFKTLLKQHFESPGHFMTGLYPTTRCQPRSPVQQLFVNCCKVGSYTYSVVTTNAELFELYDKDFHDSPSDFISPVQSPASMSASAPNSDCFNIRAIVAAIREEAQLWCEKTVLNLEALGNEEELCQALEQRYADYVNIMIVLENSLPSLSQILKSLQCQDLPSSLWELCFTVLKNSFVGSQLLEGALKSCMNLLMDIRQFSLKLVKTSAVGARYQQGCNLAFESRLSAISLFAHILEDLSVDASTVSHLEEKDWASGCYNTFIEAIQEQTTRLYKEMRKDLPCQQIKAVIKRDLSLFSGLLLPGAFAKVKKHCCDWKSQLLDDGQDLIQDSVFSTDTCDEK